MTAVVRNAKALALAAVVLLFIGCSSLGTVGSSARGNPAPSNAAPEAARILSRKDLDHVIDAGLSGRDAVSYLRNIRIADYSLQDANTNWSHIALGGVTKRLSLYYLAYRQRFFILLLADRADGASDCVDLVSMARPSPDYELGTGHVEIDGTAVDAGVIVIFNKNWKGSYSDDIVAAYRPNVETMRIDAVKYTSIRIYREP